MLITHFTAGIDFAMGLEERTHISNYAALLLFVRYVYG
jgi:hypothetical protein